MFGTLFENFHIRIGKRLTCRLAGSQAFRNT